MIGIYLTTDLFFSSRVTSQARENGWPLEMAASVDAVLEKAASHEVVLLIIDLGKFAAQTPELLADLRPGSTEMHVVAYGPHVDEASLAAARQAGCDEVLSQGQFNQLAGQILQRCFEFNA
jgi:DNA-binding NarL/FixJ family response regulator